MNKQFLNALGFTIPLATFGILLYDHSSLLVYLFAMFGAVFSFTCGVYFISRWRD